jgi:hypothetical protein
MMENLKIATQMTPHKDKTRHFGHMPNIRLRRLYTSKKALANSIAMRITIAINELTLPGRIYEFLLLTIQMAASAD